MVFWRGLMMFLPLVILTTSGCAHQTRNGLMRIWADYNSYNAPSAFYEQLSHWPEKPKRVGLYRWMYNKPDVKYSDYKELTAVSREIHSLNGVEQVIIESPTNPRGRVNAGVPLAPSVEELPAPSSSPQYPAPRSTPSKAPPVPDGALPPPLPAEEAPLQPNDGPTAEAGRVKLGSYETLGEVTDRQNPVSPGASFWQPDENRHSIRPGKSWIFSGH